MLVEVTFVRDARSITQESPPITPAPDNVVMGVFVRRTRAVFGSVIGGGVVVLNFTDLIDVPHSYTGAGGQQVRVRTTEDGLEFFTPPPSFTFIDSIEDTAGNVSLVGDDPAPGAGKHYGTDGTGAKGWQTDPVPPTLPTYIDSVTESSDQVSLIGDAPTPGANHHYGTDGTGVKGWQPDPVIPGAVNFIDSIVEDGSNNVSLQNDQSTPGASMMYATDQLGNRGWQPVPVMPPVGNYLISGGGVAWTGTGLNYQVSAATYVIAGTQYTSPQSTVTLAAADPSLDRIDVIAVDNTGSVVVITGTPGGPPIQPAVDPASQLELTFVYVPAGATTPPVTNINIYLENTEWTTTTSGGTINPASTNFPYAGTKDIEATNAANGHYVNLADPGSPIKPSDYTNLVFQIRSKASWPSPKSIVIAWQGIFGGTATGVTLKNGTFGFDSSNTTGYQQIVIPVSAFNTGSATVSGIRFTVSGGGGNIGWYIDNIILQGTGGAPPPPGGGDFSTNTNTSLPRELVLFADTSGKLGTHQSGLTPESLLALADFNGGSL